MRTKEDIGPSFRIITWEWVEPLRLQTLFDDTASE
jgi:hypothetical protein